jgi:hypothetical protein
MYEKLEEINLRNKWHFVGNETDIGRHACKMPEISSLLNAEDKFPKNCEYPLYCTKFLVEASTVCAEDGRKDVLEIIHCVSVREVISVHE